MIRILFATLLIGLALTTTAQDKKNFHDFQAITIDGDTLDMSSFKGKKILVVNTASKCGLTPQYEGLEELNKKYAGEKFAIIGFPANDFLKQEPGTDDEIKTFCQKNYGVSFQMMSKITVKGKGIHPIYKWLTDKDENGKFDEKVKWNFQKFLIDENGNLVEVHSPSTAPLGGEIEAWVKK